jgi:septal ring factor EnvC (AmiA/AmiB activator)
LRHGGGGLDWRTVGPLIGHRSQLVAVALLVGVLGLAGTAVAQRQEERELAAVREQITALTRRLERNHATLEKRYSELKRAETDSATAAEALRDVRARLNEQRTRGRELADQTRQASVRLDTERSALASQVRMSFLAGRQETLKLMLNQESPARLGRMMTYYDYLNRARSERIKNVSVELDTLARLAEATAEVTRELTALEGQQQRELERLESLRADREVAVRELGATIGSEEQEVERLRAEEQRLSELVRELESALAEFPVDSQEPFSTARGKLPWPVTGRLLSRYGEQRAGPQLRWQGVQVGAKAGTPVRAIYHGRVVYSDWLPGLGMLVIVDHGEGYMSLYGHNEALLKEAGDWVTPGEVLAQVGDSGGQAQMALYFEIRKDGEPVDPARWLGRAEPQPQ